MTPFTHACKARPLTIVGWTSLSVSLSLSLSLSQQIQRSFNELLGGETKLLRELGSSRRGPHGDNRGLLCGIAFLRKHAGGCERIQSGEHASVLEEVKTGEKNKRIRTSHFLWSPHESVSLEWFIAGVEMSGFRRHPCTSYMVRHCVATSTADDSCGMKSYLSEPTSLTMLVKRRVFLIVWQLKHGSVWTGSGHATTGFQVGNPNRDRFHHPTLLFSKTPRPFHCTSTLLLSSFVCGFFYLRGFSFFYSPLAPSTTRLALILEITHLSFCSSSFTASARTQFRWLLVDSSAPPSNTPCPCDISVRMFVTVHVAWGLSASFAVVSGVHQGGLRQL